jgi:hypothetical protein
MNRREFLKTGLPVAAAAPLLLRHSAFAQTAQPALPLPPAGADGWVSLINGRDLTGWYTMLQNSGKDVAQTRGMVEIEEGMLHVLGAATGPGAEPGYIATNREFENVHIRVEYKWGMKRFAPRLEAKRDNGLLYALVGEDKVWPRCVECQIEEGDVGDYFLCDGVRGVQDGHGAGFFGEGLTPDGRPPRPGNGHAASGHGTPPPEPTTGRKIKDGNFEKLDEWNVVEVIMQGDRSAHIVNGRTVNAISRLQQPDPQNPDQFIPLTRGKIAIEIEYSEIWYRRIEVRNLA